MQQLSDGSLLVATSDPVGTSFFNSTGRLIRLVDADGNGIADGPGTPVYTTSTGTLTAVRAAGDLVAVLSVGQQISILRAGANPGDTLTLQGTIDFSIPGGWEHVPSGLAMRESPGQPGSYDLIFQLGASGNDTATPPSAEGSVSGLVSGTLQGDSLHMVTITDNGDSVTGSGPTQIANGLRNPAGIDFHPITGDLYFEDNGIDTPGNRTEALSADELNFILAAGIGGDVENFGFADNYTQYRTGVIVGGLGIQPLIAAEIAFAPSGFPDGLNDGVFVGFHGQSQLAGLSNEENPLVYVNLTNQTYFHFIEVDEPGIGHLDGLLATEDSLFVADLSSNGSLGNGAGFGRIYQIHHKVPEPSTFLFYVVGLLGVAGFRKIGPAKTRPQSSSSSP